MHKHLLKYWVLLLMMTLFLPACQREQAEEPQVIPPSKDGVWTKVHYRAEVSGSKQTKATLDDIDRHYIFERDDLLYVVDKATGGNVLYGYLFLISGAEATKAVFEGDLMYFVETVPSSGVYEPERPSNNLAVTATLVSKTQRDSGVYTFEDDNDGKIDTGPNFVGDGCATSFKEAVQKYSTFTADATYGNPSFSLVQGTAFLLFSLAFDDDVPASLTVSVTNNNGADNLFSHSISPNVNHEANFVAALPGGTITLSDAKLTVSDAGSFNKEKILASRTLEGNHYYNVVKTFLNLDYFTILARDAATTISFSGKFQDAAFGLQYSSNGVDWTNVSATPSFELTAGSSVRVRGKGYKYQNSDGTSPLFTSSTPCYIYGDIMSLFCDGSYNKKTGFSESGTNNRNALDGTFKNITNLDIHPARPLLLSAQTLASACYQNMFAGCTGLTRAPEFNNEEGAFADDIPSSACKQMFQGCTSLSAAPELPATGTIDSQGYYGMFDGCTAMLTPPSRLAVTPSGGNGHFREMFNGCTSLLLAPELTATVILQDGCSSMFNGCTSLQEAPELLANTISGTYACAYMFQNCTSLTQGPSALLATDMQNYCYAWMFKGCTSLEEAPRIDATTLADYCFQEMFSGCTMLRTAQDEFSFTGNIPQYACKQMFYNCLVLQGAPDMPSVTGTIDLGGCMQMYYGCEAMTKAPSSLNATTVNEAGYQEMFRGCTHLQTPTASLPATTLVKKAYYKMFYDCTALTSIPDFPHDPDATYVLGNGTGDPKNNPDGICYQMFFRCNSLTTLKDKKLFNSISALGKSCFQDMFSTCSKLKTVPDDFLPATTLAESCYRGMFQSTIIEEAPELPATILVKDCYRWMFTSCSRLNLVICYGSPGTGDTYTNNWLSGVAATGTFKTPAGSTWKTDSINGIPSGWTRTTP